ncbi:MAG TPA: sensor domain-containing diguanylate cyclase [Steroidobacteraceae bacterium]|nr:sensor domain-containing diguanylate cyclase [Steroidobacteraceae bacterium]
MKSGPDKRAGFAAFLPRSIVARTSLSILVLAVIMGLLFSITASWRVRAAEHDRLMSRVDELASTVESTVSVACFVNDTKLAQEIANGLMKNRIVAGVTITSGRTILFGTGTIIEANARAHAKVDKITRPVYSPFEKGPAIGGLTIYVSHEEIEAQATAYSGYITWILSLQVAIVAAAVAFLVYLLVTRPIKGISDELHRLEVASGVQIALRGRRRTDEIGQLVGDVNALITRLTDVLQKEHQLRVAQEISERRMRLVFEKADTGILVLDPAGAVQSCNPAFVRILGAEAAEPNVRLADLLAPHGERIARLIGESRASGEPRDADFEIDRGGVRGSIWVELSVNPLGHNLLQGLLTDVTERKRAESAARELASRDTVTGLLNRRGLDASLANLLTTNTAQHPLALLQIDLDYFKEVNDTFGHEAGDRVLREVGAILERSVRRTDVVARTGGDEFVVVLPGIESVEKAKDIAVNVIAGVSVPIVLSAGRRAEIGASIGIALAVPGEGASALLRRADTAMYTAKQSGRGRVCLAQTGGDEPPATHAAA